MPELPEVETVKEVLKTKIKGLLIEDVELYYEKMIKNVSAEEFKDRVKGQRIQDILRRGKYLIFQLEDYNLLSHLRMEGKFSYEVSGSPKRSHVHAIFKFNNGNELWYEDVRKFGTFHLYEKKINLEETPPFKVLGVEPFSDEFTSNYMKAKLENKKKPIKSLLLDQSVVCGLGNIYVDEVLFRAKVHPLTQSSKLTEKEIEDVVKYTVEVLKHAIKLKGTTIRTFSSQHGVSGSFQNELRVHQRKDEACIECSTVIEKIKVGGRGTYFCRKCQVLKNEDEGECLNVKEH